ncbi:MAG: hypothetical protein HC862_02340 [Scytonema sp. RU_4_4]|nr:hypothetical protein [Scytonema sp. RU_4_4]
MFLDEEELKFIGTKLIDEIAKLDVLSLKPIFQKNNHELQTSSKKHNIPVSNVA